MISILIPYRDEHKEQKRSLQLNTFIDYMSSYLKGYDVRFYVIEQSADGRLFNKGALLNFGFSLVDARAEKSSLYIFHDVDLLPSDDLWEFYTRPPARGTVHHIAGVWKRYDSASYFGGVVAFNGADFRDTNGFPNQYWGWGGEDDELRDRVRGHGLTIARPSRGTMTDLEQLTLSDKLLYLKTNCLKNKEKRAQRARRRPADDGLANVSGKILSVAVDGTMTRIVVEIGDARQCGHLKK